MSREQAEILAKEVLNKLEFIDKLISEAISRTGAEEIQVIGAEE